MLVLFPLLLLNSALTSASVLNLNSAFLGDFFRTRLPVSFWNRVHLRLLNQ
ncbi:uncharacterized protein G2W53_026417 [Senna tora]|uniref:Uncharacterized protein n=1 Tax=Senna tora TaxID=362788 RepID=A0A834TF27_9FABA|nr:uncharacterized protein G2W53_026417 [Senna tora]